MFCRRRVKINTSKVSSSLSTATQDINSQYKPQDHSKVAPAETALIHYFQKLRPRWETGLYFKTECNSDRKFTS